MVPASVKAAEAESSAMLKLAARAAAESGDFASAARNLRDSARLSGNERLEQQAGEFAERLEGGNALANFDQLIELMQQHTGSPEDWEEADPPREPLPYEQGNGVFMCGPAALASLMLRHDSSGLDRVAEAVATANRNENIRQPSALRLVSLSRLERTVAQQLATGGELSSEIHNLAGISRVEYLFTFPETGDVVIGGPAADWVTDTSGRSVSVTNGRPVLQLDDLVVLGRTFADDGPAFFRCSIDPKQQQIEAVNDFVGSNRQSLNRKTAADFAQRLENILGLQDVVVSGIPQDSRVAGVIVAADYRMKQIGIGEVHGAPGMKSYFDLLSRSEQRGGGKMDALRWWMAAGYEAVRMAPSGNVFEFAGNSARCLSEDQVVNANGSRVATGKASGANAKFARLFTQHFESLAKTDPVFADLENVFDLSMVMALIHAQGLEADARLDSPVFRQAGTFETASVDVPTELMTAATHRVFRGRHVVIQVAGGVRGDMAAVVADADRLQVQPALAEQSLPASPLGQGMSRWWWDAEVQ